MWKNQNTRCIFSPAEAVDFSRMFSTASRPCAPLKSRTSRQASSTPASQISPCGMMSRPSAPTTPNSAKCSPTSRPTSTSLSFAAGFLARIYRLRDAARAYRERVVDCGLNTFASFVKFNPDGSLPKIVQCSLFGDSIAYSADFPQAGMMRRGKCYPLPPWVAVMSASGFGLLADGVTTSGSESPWATPTVFGNNNRKGMSAKSGDGLATQAKEVSALAWPTPTCAGLDGGSNSRNAAKKRYGHPQLFPGGRVDDAPTPGCVLEDRPARQERGQFRGLSPRIAERG